MKKKEIESQIAALEKIKLAAIKTQDYSRVAKLRDKVREMMYKLSEV